MNAPLETLQINIKMGKQGKPIYTRYYLTEDDRRDIILKIGDAALLLMEYYIRLAAVGDKEIRDDLAAQYFGWSLQKAKRYRLGLQKEGWFKSHKYKVNQHITGITYYIGREEVEKISF